MKSPIDAMSGNFQIERLIGGERTIGFEGNLGHAGVAAVDGI